VINNRDKAILESFGKHLRTIRESKNLSQQQLGYDARISKNQIGNIERGEVNATLISILAISKALQILPEELINFEK